MSQFDPPEEVLDCIVSEVGKLSDLLPLMTASRALNRITTPHLYHNIFFNIRHYEDPGLAYLRSLTYHLLKHPEIARLIHSFELRNSYDIEQVVFPPGYSNKYSWPAQDDLDDILRSAIGGLQYKGSEAEDIFSTARTGGNETAILAILLQSLPNLENFLTNVRLVPLEGTDYVMNAFQRCTSLSTDNGYFTPFRNLKAALMQGEDEKYPSNFELFGACLALPAMRRAFGRHLGSGDYDSDDPELETVPLQTLLAQSSNLELLHVEYSKLNKAELFALLRAPKKLKTFIYELGNDAWSWTPVSIPDIAQALQPHYAWLEELCLIYDDVHIFDDDEGSDFTPLSLRECTSLKVLKIAPVFLLGQEAFYSEISGDIKQFCKDFCSRFPASLEVLHFADSDDGFSGTEPYVVSALETLVQQKARFLPNLKSLTLEGRFSGGVDVVTRIIELAQGMGIHAGMDNGWDHGRWGTNIISGGIWW
jgi:hypothetical protein